MHTACTLTPHFLPGLSVKNPHVRTCPQFGGTSQFVPAVRWTIHLTVLRCTSGDVSIHSDTLLNIFVHGSNPQSATNTLTMRAATDLGLFGARSALGPAPSLPLRPPQHPGLLRSIRTLLHHKPSERCIPSCRLRTRLPTIRDTSASVVRLAAGIRRNSLRP